LLFVAISLAILVVLANAGAAHAHASLIRSEPADGAVVAQQPPELKLTFNEPVSPLGAASGTPGQRNRGAQRDNDGGRSDNRRCTAVRTVARNAFVELARDFG